jgi:tryptophan synthase alpha chain
VSRIAETFARLRRDGQPGLVTYTTAGDPDLARSAEVLVALDRAGADVLEVGVPFSDPLADGPVIQRATERALASGGNLRETLRVVAQVRRAVRAPIVIFSYANPLLRMGLERFAHAAADAGVDGVLTLDLPIEEADEFRAVLARVGIDTIFLLSPTTTEARIERAAELGRGFLYGISRLGVTGARDAVSADARAHVVEVGGYADAAVVGSALVSRIAEAGASPRLIDEVVQYVRGLKHACETART